MWEAFGDPFYDPIYPSEILFGVLLFEFYRVNVKMPTDLIFSDVTPIFHEK